MSGAYGPPGKKLVYEVKDVSADGIAESLTVPGDNRVRSAVVISPESAFVQRIGAPYAIDFAPFLFAFGDAKNLPVPRTFTREVQTDSMVQAGQLSYTVRVVGNETVKVPGGTFEAIRVTIEGAGTVRLSPGFPSPARAQYDIWYSPAAKRRVKLIARSQASNHIMEDNTFELAEIRLGTPGTANPMAAPAPQNRPATVVATAAQSTAAPSAVSVALASLIPKEGDTWIYQHTDNLSRVNNSLLTYRVKSVGPNEIEDVLTIPGKLRQPAALTFDLDFDNGKRGALEFSTPEIAPYLQSFHTLTPGKQWKFTAPVSINAASFRFNGNMPFTATVAGSEKVTVPAGTFDSIKVVVSGQTILNGWGNAVFRMQHEIWYSPQVKRFVKYSSQGYAGAAIGESVVAELTRFELQ